MDLADIQKELQAARLDGWLIADFQGRNECVKEILSISPEILLTRRFLYWIPTSGDPVQIVHKIESHILASLPGTRKQYSSWESFEAAIGEALDGAKIIAMEYSPRNAIPNISTVDGGMIDLIRSFGVEVVSSAPFLQRYSCILDKDQEASHFEAAEFLDKTASETWKWISECLRAKRPLTEYDVRQFILGEFSSHGFTSEGSPICAVNAHSADPHYEPKKEGSSPIRQGDFILIDLWCKKKKSRAVYADISRVAVAAPYPNPKQLEIFNLVRKAQKAATDDVIEKYRSGALLRGCDVDQLCREVIIDGGYGEFFTHRTGHNIYTRDHGPGANIDNLETQDTRTLLPHTCFSIEPGIYLPEAFGVRLEYDIFLGSGGKAHITGGIQDTIVALG